MNYRGTNQFKKKKNPIMPAKMIAQIYFTIVIAVIVTSAYGKINHKDVAHAYISPLAKSSVDSSRKVVTPTPTPTKQPIQVVKGDKRIKQLQSFLESKGSPLANYADVFVAKADTYGLDWSLMPAISGKESSFGRALLPNSFNPFGLGGASGFMYFNSWDEAIDFEARLLSKHYRWNANRAIQQKYCPDSECSSTWTDDVTTFSMNILKGGENNE